MNIIKIDFEKIRKCIDEYILQNNDYIRYCVDTIAPYNKPIILMSNDTLNFLKTKYYYCIINKEKVSTIFECYIAIADWLSFGEVQLK